MLELKTLISAMNQLKELVGQHNAHQILDGRDVYIHRLTEYNSEKMVQDLTGVGLWAIASNSSSAPTEFTVLVHLQR